jgi:hypothetical protein
MGLLPPRYRQLASGLEKLSALPEPLRTARLDGRAVRNTASYRAEESNPRLSDILDFSFRTA